MYNKYVSMLKEKGTSALEPGTNLESPAIKSCRTIEGEQKYYITENIFYPSIPAKLEDHKDVD